MLIQVRKNASGVGISVLSGPYKTENSEVLQTDQILCLYIY